MPGSPAGRWCFPSAGYRNGYGRPSKLALSNGTITVRRPRVRDVDERFESRILPLFVRRTKEVGDLLPELYLHGLSQGDFELALRGLLGDGVPLRVGRARPRPPCVPVIVPNQTARRDRPACLPVVVPNQTTRLGTT